MEFVVKCLQFTAQEWGNEKAAKLTFLHSQVCHHAFSLLKMKYTPCSKKVVHQAHIDNLVNSQRIFIIPSLAHCLENLR